MLKTIHESEVDLAHERRIAEELGGRWKCVFKKLPMELTIDFSMYREAELVAHSEFKRRAISINEYDTCIFSKRKLDAGMAFEQESGKPFLFISEYTDGLFYLPCAGVDFQFRMMRCKEPDGSIEEVECAEFPIKLFKQIR